MSRHGGIHTDRQPRLYCTRRSYFAPISNSETSLADIRPLLVVEAPGYCPPGPKCLFHATVYRHSRVAPAGTKIGICAARDKFAWAQAGCYAMRQTRCLMG